MTRVALSGLVSIRSSKREERSILPRFIDSAPDGRLASGSFDKTIRLWEVTSGAETARLEGHSSAVSALCLLPDGRLAAGTTTLFKMRLTSLHVEGFKLRLTY